MSWARRFPADVATADDRPGVWRDEFGQPHCPTCGGVTGRSKAAVTLCRCPVVDEEPIVESQPAGHLLAALDRAVGAARAVSGR